MPTINSVAKRLKRLEARQPQAQPSNLKERIALYKHILDTEDFESREGRCIKATLDRYADAIAELE